MDENKMLKNDMGAMSYEEVLDNLSCFLDLSRFDSSTGETETLYHMKMCGNELNYPLYVAVSKCIYLVQKELATNSTESIETDPVNRPAHYTDGKIEVIDYIEDKKLGFCLGNAIKYISRAGKKDPEKEVEDLNKAIWYIERRIKELTS